MATRRYGISRGERGTVNVAEAVGAATTSDSMEFTVDLAVNLTREDVLLGLETIRYRIIEGDWPPA